MQIKCYLSPEFVLGDIDENADRCSGFSSELVERVFHLLVIVHRSRSPSVRVIGQTSSAPSSCHTPTVRRSSRAPETASSTTPTQRRAPSRTDSVSSLAIMEQLMRYRTGERSCRHVFLALTQQLPPDTPLYFCFIRL